MTDGNRSQGMNKYEVWRQRHGGSSFKKLWRASLVVQQLKIYLAIPVSNITHFYPFAQARTPRPPLAPSFPALQTSN